MKVMCIEDRFWKKDYPCPKVGEIVTVSKAYYSPYTDNEVYDFHEYPPPPGCAFRCFSQKYFAPLSEIDETKLVNVVPEVATA